MKLLLDANISWRITKSLSSNYPESAHVLDFFEHHTADLKIWDFTQKEGFVIVSNDEDFS